MLRHERACDAANKTTKERRSFGLEEVHPGEPYGRPNSPPEPEEQADSERMSHRAHMGLCRRVGSRRRPSVHLPCFSSAATDRSRSASSASGLTRPRHSLSISNARVATAPLANLLALGRTGVAFAPVLSEPF